MHITIELKAGPNGSDFVTPADVQKNIDALTEALKTSPAWTTTCLVDTRSILEAIKRQLQRQQPRHLDRQPGPLRPFSSLTGDC